MCNICDGGLNVFQWRPWWETLLAHIPGRLIAWSPWVPFLAFYRQGRSVTWWAFCWDLPGILVHWSVAWSDFLISSNILGAFPLYNGALAASGVFKWACEHGTSQCGQQRAALRDVYVSWHNPELLRSHCSLVSVIRVAHSESLCMVQWQRLFLHSRLSDLLKSQCSGII